MSNVAIKVEAISKEYHIGGPQKTYDRLGDQLVDMFKTPFRRAGNLLSRKVTSAAELNETIWALKDVSFEVKHGEVVGIIGRNGAGKSTLLKILSQITDPTGGYADLYGRVGSLLEVGTGFHPELTGRENIYLNGAILGMRKSEIDRKFDEIVAFAEIDKFIDTPVKHYSSGMYVRLAFSVAAHLEPEILLVDEVLAVGDVSFQRKCLGKMDDVAQQGRTVLFVSHNMGLMQALCQRGIFLQSGSVFADGTMAEVVDAYMQTLEQAESENLVTRTDRRGKGSSKLIDLEVKGKDGSRVLKTGSPISFVVCVDNLVTDIGCSIYIHDHIGQPIAALSNNISGPYDTTDSGNELKIVCEIDELLLLPGRYRIDIAITGDNALQDYVEAAAMIDVSEGSIGGRPTQISKKYRVSMPHRWRFPDPLPNLS